MSESEQHFNQLKEKFGDHLVFAEITQENRIKLQVSAENLLEIMQFIASELNFTTLASVAGVDWETHFEVVYHLDRWDGDPTVIQVHVKLEDRDNPEVPSVTSIWASANWHERETFDLYGINISNHPNLKRLLLPEDWDDFEHKHISELYPMRRDYQLPEKPFSFKPHPKQ
ncbi:MAG: NADH-quinone oxidoreductase subunit C [Candidatus Hodarchaeales archaeon]|jgi:NADH-quinone oxidoreductase subunit C